VWASEIRGLHYQLCSFNATHILAKKGQSVECDFALLLKRYVQLPRAPCKAIYAMTADISAVKNEVTLKEYL